MYSDEQPIIYVFQPIAGIFVHCLLLSCQSFPVRSLGWMEMAEQDLCEGRSSMAVHHCIRQLSYCRRDIRDSAGVWGEVSLMTIARTTTHRTKTEVLASQEVIKQSVAHLFLMRLL